MGFGLLLLGYLAANVMAYSFVPKLIGYALMMWGCIKLSEYDLKFRRCLLIAAPATVLAIYVDANKICKMLGVSTDLFPQKTVSLVNTAEIYFSLGFCILLMLAIVSISKSTELDKLAFKAARNIVVMSIGEALYAVALLLPYGEVANGIAYVAIIIRFFHIILDLAVIFACFRMICKEGDEEMPAKEIKIPVLRKMEEVLNKRDKNAFDSARNLSEKRAQRKSNKKKK